ncbi:hypothetical protein AX16_000612 [Volvariella volvacea WC 439]|nr:hypothetical protein AX16_000612 [Volvariella volvacea WC 439]
MDACSGFLRCTGCCALCGRNGPGLDACVGISPDNVVDNTCLDFGRTPFVCCSRHDTDTTLIQHQHQNHNQTLQTPTAVTRLRNLLSGPTPQLIRIGVRNKGCAGLSYHLDYVEKPGKFDEVVEQDGVKVLVDSKALFSIIGSEMDWTEDPLSSKFTFKNPNIKDSCGCGESFTVGSS